MRGFWRIAAAGAVAALIVGAGGWAMERVRFGASDTDAVARAAAELDRRLDAAAAGLADATAAIAAETDTLAVAGRDPDARRRLFSVAAAALPAHPVAEAGLTVYDASGAPIAWAGRVSEFARPQLATPALFIATGAAGPRLVRVDAVPAGTGAPDHGASVVAEFALGPPGTAAALAGGLELPTIVGPAEIQPAGAPPADHAVSASALVTPLSAAGVSLATAAIEPTQIADARSRWRRRTFGAVLLVFGLVIIAAGVPVAGWQHRARTPARVLAASAALVALGVGARAVFWFALAPFTGADPPARPMNGSIDLLLTALLAALITWLILDLETRRRLARPRPRLLARRGDAIAALAPAYFAAGALTAWGLWTYAGLLGRVTPGSALDQVHLALRPPNAPQLALAFGLLLLHAAAVWTAVAVTRLPGLAWRTRRDWHVAIGAPAWLAGALAGVALLRSSDVAPLVAALAGVAVCRVATARPHARIRRASQASRVFWYSLALIVPAIALYPTLLAFATAARESLIASSYAPQVASMREDLQDRLRQALEDIDQQTTLGDLPVALPPADQAPDVGPAFAIWQRTDLARYRLTSAVELYDAQGRLVSRFALSLPEQPTPEYRAAGCDWDMIEETSPFGASDRHWLRASRGICENGRPVGAIVVRVMLDYRRLMFIAPQNPYLESLSAEAPGGADETVGRDIELAIYGWSRTPVDATGERVWLLPDPVFERLVASRQPFWTNLRRDDQTYRVFLLNDRGGIYALGYPVDTTFAHLLNLAELVTLALILYVLLVAAATVTGVLAARAGTSGRGLLREIRSSFYRKLVLYFGAGAVIPVAILALATRAYLTAQLNAREQESATQTATVARRLVEDYVALQERNQAALAAVDDQLMVLVSRAIDQDVNLFDGPDLQATSNRALFASGLLTERTPADVFAAISLDRQKAFVGVESIGGGPYLLAAEPVRAGGREGIVTVPLTLRQAETERQRDELDRRVLLGAVLFSLMGAGLGYYLAERVADPVNRLTRATRRIARGDLDARIAATSSDELRRLVEDFNRMAADLQRQRRELERTQRLEAWAEMARQVAHEIKNPLTPIQLSAEHARRVNLDRGQPLSPVLDECVAAILSQVRLLRQIASEFSSFASSPTARLEPTDVAALIEEVLEPYRAGLPERVALHVHAAPDLPRVNLDRTLVARAITNIVENALHAMPAGGILSVASRRSPVARGESRVIVELSDTGVGMDDDAVARIFEPYFSTKATGTGLGLTIAKRNIELNGGTIAVRSAKGLGTTVTIEVG